MTFGYVGWRLLQVVPTAAAILLIGFLLIHLAPGDPVVALAGQNGDAEYYAFIRDKFGLDEPLPEQLATYASRVVQADLGTSYLQGRPVATIIAERIPATLLLSVTALVLSSVAGVALGSLAASRPHGLVDVASTGATLAVYAAPVFWLGQLAILGLAAGLGWFPVQGMTSPRSDATGLAAALDVAHHLALPALVLASQEIAAVFRLTRVGLLDELGSDHVRTARAKGLSARRVLVKHALRRPLVPVVTVIGGRAGHLLSGAIVTEIVFGWPGLGRLLLSSLQTRDTPVVLGIFLVVAFFVILANVGTDLTYRWLDPRVRYR
ncbi:MAG TPA: ABC transporter permease [Acidimicrobiales bacterium]|nr:ABC transporter permease [Acidimicrobiales bacterium]